MEKGTLVNFQGKSLDEIEIEDEIDLDLDEEEVSDDDNEESEPVSGVSEKTKMGLGEADSSTGKSQMNQDETENSRETKLRRIVKRPWSPNEVNAVMKHFRVHISKGHLATKAECEQCKAAEDPLLRERTAQNIRDFVRNRGLMLKKKSS
ncbi:uncharacterized protein LOC130073635 isoform X2 [Rhinichthys klamathensis goyatoka]|uniref:uncharacterized protein LOC130073635 isoform X2 n=1 Tax=Rhinichthys klamathensis goyatoka TaxID=3034132 RepID=UPI0024B5DD8D|nr:uncharacterized protein LOC130073635 isoform X2 [Rhinichthys klamathensis goyatoka]